MFDRRFVCTGVAIAAVAVLSFFISRQSGPVEVAPIAESVAGIERRSEPSSSKTAPEPGEYAYLLKEHDGRVAVFQAGSDEPELVLDVLVKYLPDYDRSQMQAGIPVKDYSSLVSLIEDYIS